MAKGTPAAPSNSDQLVSNGFDFGDWTVSTHGSTASGSKDTTGLTMPPWLILAGLALAAVVAVRWISKR